MKLSERFPHLLSTLLLILGLAGCGGSGGDEPIGGTAPVITPTFSVGGSIVGLTGVVVLQNNGGDDLTITSDGTFTFATELVDGATYDVTVLTQPTDEVCFITMGSGTINAADVSDVSAECEEAFAVGGTVSGLTGTLVLQNNGADDLTITSNGPFSFATKLLNDEAYNVTILSQSAGQVCSVSSGSGTIDNADIADVTVNCVSLFTVGGTMIGLTGTVVLQNNGGDDLTISSNGSFSFSMPVLDGDSYDVTVLSQPSQQVCTINLGSGTIGGSNVIDVVASCEGNFAVGGTISGLSGTIVLQNNGAEDLTLTANGPFSFPRRLLSGESYDITVLTQPAGQVCTVSLGNGVVANADITDVAVNCVSFFTVGGTISGLAGTVVLQNNGGDDLTLADNGPFVFATSLADGSSYSVTILSQPLGQTCSISLGSGVLAGADVSNVLATTVLDSFSVGGVMSGLTGTVTLQNNGGDDLVLSANGPFTFDTSVLHDSTYEVTVLGEPLGQTCRVTLGSGTIAGAVVDDVAADCVDNVALTAYVANRSSNSISAFTVNPVDGTLLPLGADVPAGFAPVSVEVDPTGRFAYVANVSSDDIATYSVDQATGELTEVGSRVGTGSAPQSLAVHPSGRFVYTANEFGGNVSAFEADAVTGLLTPLGSPVSVGGSPFSIDTDAVGRFAYVVGRSSNQVATFSIDPLTGELTPVGLTAQTGSLPQSVTVHPSGRFAYVTSFGESSIRVFSIDPNTGALAQVGIDASTFLGRPQALAIDPTGRFAYVPNLQGDFVISFTIDPLTGVLTEAGYTINAGSGANAVTIDPTGRFVYIANSVSSDVSIFEINQTFGFLSKVGIDVAVGVGPRSVAITPARNFALTANASTSDASTFGVDASSGELSEVGTSGTLGGAARTIAVGPGVRFAYVANDFTSNVSSFEIDPITGLLSELGTEIATGGAAKSMTVSPNGLFAYTANGGADSVSLFRVDPFSGVLAPFGLDVAAGSKPRSIKIEPKGRFAYVCNQDSDNVTTFSINPMDGVLRLSCTFSGSLTG